MDAPNIQPLSRFDNHLTKEIESANTFSFTKTTMTLRQTHSCLRRWRRHGRSTPTRFASNAEDSPSNPPSTANCQFPNYQLPNFEPPISNLALTSRRTPPPNTVQSSPLHTHQPPITNASQSRPDHLPHFHHLGLCLRRPACGGTGGRRLHLQRSPLFAGGAGRPALCVSRRSN